MLRFDVADTGVGLSAEATEHLFAPFTQADASTTRRFGGTGLGLAISKRLAELLGGDIVLRSTPGEGSVFSLTIEMDSPDGVAISELPPSGTSGDQAPNGSLHARVLLAEDTPDSRDLFVYYLEEAGVEVETVADGLAAYERTLAAAASGTPFDVVLMDMQMPKLDGERATLRLRQVGYTGAVVALTAHAMGSEREKCLRAGCDAFVSKPVEPEELLAAVRRYTLARRAPSFEHPATLKSTLSGGRALMELLAKFIDNLPERLSAIEQSLAAGDVPGVARLAHQLKGSSASYGFPPLAAAADRLEQDAKSPLPTEVLHRDLEAIAELCRSIQAGPVSDLTARARA
jgi:CheY-like chemotaxis protein/HPt (histidine-containing phosphotransfer) domain-containing protein